MYKDTSLLMGTIGSKNKQDNFNFLPKELHRMHIQVPNVLNVSFYIPRQTGFDTNSLAEILQDVVNILKAPSVVDDEIF